MRDKLAHIQLWQGVESRGLRGRPAEFRVPDPNRCIGKKHEIDCMIVMSMGKDDVRDILGAHPVCSQLGAKFTPHPKRTDVEQRDAPSTAQQRNRAPA
jgi:hypothetical protein